MIYTSGVWNVKEGREDEFSRAWQQLVDAMSIEYTGMAFRLMREVENQSHFLSMAGPWRNAEQVADARASRQFQDSMQSVQDLLESGEIKTYELVADVS